MAARFNTRFALILAVVVVAVVAVVGGLAVLRMRADAERHIKAGDAFMQTGEYREALGAYGRAVSKKPGNPDYLNKMQLALVKIEPKNRADTENLMRTFEGIQDRRASLDPGKGANYLPLLEYWRAYAEEGDVGAAWDRLRAQADRMVGALEDRKNESDPDYLRGRLERGAAVIRKGFAKSGAVRPTSDERKNAIADLNQAKDQYPDEAYSLLAWQAFDEAERLRLAGQNDKVTTTREEGEGYLKEGLEKTEGKGPRMRTLAARRLLESKQSVSKADLDAAVTALFQALGPVNDRWVLLDAEPVVLATARRSTSFLETQDERATAMGAAMAAMESIYRDYLGRYPDDLVVRVELADLLVREAKLADAINEAQRVIDSKPLPFGIDALLQRDRQVAACSVQIESLVAQWDLARKAGNTDAAGDVVKDAKRVYETMKLLADNREDEPLLLLAQGNVLFMEDKWPSASEKYEAYVAQVPPGRIAPALVLDRAFIAAGLAGSHAVAAERYEQLALADPSGEMSLNRAIGAAAVYLELKEWTRARDLGRLFLAAPGNENSVEAKRVVAQANKNIAEESDGSAVDQQSSAVQDNMSAIGNLTRDGQYVKAREAAQEAIESDPKEPAYRRALVMAEIAAGNFESARDAAQKALDELPDLSARERGILSTVVSELGTDSDDPVEMSVKVANILAEPYAEEDKPLVQLQVLTAGLGRKKLELAFAERGGRTAAVEDLRDQVQDFTGLIEERRLALEATPIAKSIEIRFRAAQAAEKLDWMRSDLDAAEKAGTIDASNLVILKAAYEVTRAQKEATSGAAPDLVRAERLVEDAIKAYPRNARLLETMAEIKKLRGERFAAMTFYEQAVKISGSTGNAGLALAALQAETGDRKKALDTLKKYIGGTRIEAVQVPVREQLLSLEADVGNRNEALQSRRDLYTARPGDILNNVGLAALLVSTMPQFDDIVDVRGVPRYTETTWKQLPRPNQQEQLQQVRQAWRLEANTILKELRQQAATDERAALGAAQLLQMPEFQTPELNGLNEAKQVLQDRIDRAGDAATAAMWVDLGRVAVAARDAETANRAFTTAQSLQDPTAREVDRELGRIFLALSARQDATANLKKAEQHLRAVLETNPADVPTQVDLAQCLVLQVGRQEADLPALDEADTLLKAVAKVRADPDALLLQAQVALLRGERMSRDQSKGVQERWDALVEAIDSARPILASAAQAQRGVFNSRIPATEARMLYGAWLTAPDRDNNPAAQQMLGDAERILDSAIAQQQSAWDLVALRQQIRVARQDFAGAKKALIDFVDANPDEGQARQTLIALLVQTQDVKTALDVARGGADLSPASADWPLLMHEIAWNTNRRNEAIEYGEWAYRLDPERTAPFLVGSLINRGFNDDFARVIQVTNEQKDLTAKQSFMLGAQGAALVRSGPSQRAKGVAALTASYVAFQKDVAKAKAEGGAMQSIAPWYNLARIAFVGDPRAVQQLAEQSKGNTALTGEELRSLASIWSQRVDTNGRPDIEAQRQGLTVYQQALGKLEAEGASAAERAALLFELGTAEYQAGNCANAIERYEQGLKLSDAPQPALENNLAYLYYLCNQDLERSLEHSEKSVRQAPGNPEFLDTLGELYLRRFQKSGSRSDLDQAEERLTQGLIVGNLLATRINLAEVLIEKGLNERANTILREALREALSKDLTGRIKSLQDRIANGRTGG